MNFKFDENLDARFASILVAEGHNVATAISQSLGGKPDEVIYGVCQSEHRALVSLDLDFANPLRFPVSNTSGIIILRPARSLLPLIRSLIEQLPPLLRREQLSGRLWIVEPGRLRIFQGGEKEEME